MQCSIVFVRFFGNVLVALLIEWHVDAVWSVWPQLTTVAVRLCDVLVAVLVDWWGGHGTSHTERHLHTVWSEHVAVDAIPGAGHFQQDYYTPPGHGTPPPVGECLPATWYRHTYADRHTIHFASAAVAVSSSHMTASSSASWSRFSSPSKFVSGHMSTMWLMVCRWPQLHTLDTRCRHTHRQGDRVTFNKIITHPTYPLNTTSCGWVCRPFDIDTHTHIQTGTQWYRVSHFQKDHYTSPSHWAPPPVGECLLATWYTWWFIISTPV